MASASNWNFFPTNRRISERLSEKLGTALAEATAVCPQERWQSWKIQIQDQFVELWMGEERGDESMADWREKIIRCGVALQSLKLSLIRQGCRARLKLFPELEHPFMVARVYLSEGGRDYEPEMLPLNVMTPESIQPSLDLSISETVFNLMSQAVAGERCWLEIAQGQRSRERLFELAGVNEEWLFQIKGERPNSPPASPGGWQKFILGVKLRAPLPEPEARIELDLPDASGAFAVIKTKTDDKFGWMAAGQTSALLLEAAGRFGVSCAFFNQALRKPSVRQELRMSIGHKGFGQAIVQLKMAGNPLASIVPMVRPAVPRSVI